MKWTSQKAVDFLLIKKPTITLKQHFFDQLCLFEEILQKRHGFVLSKDWQSQFSCPEDEMLTNTYLNTLPKGRKSPRASMTDKPTDKSTSICWNRKIKELIAPKQLHLSDVMKNATIKFETIGNESSGKHVVESSMGNEDLENGTAGTVKRQFKVILKSKSAKGFDERTADGLSFDAVSMSANTLGVGKVYPLGRRQSSGVLEDSDNLRPPTSQNRESSNNFEHITLRRNSSLPQENFHQKDWNNLQDPQGRVFKTQQKIKPSVTGAFKLKPSNPVSATTNNQIQFREPSETSDPERTRATGNQKTVRSELGKLKCNSR